jgi:electron transport complex protein RnfC
MIRSATPTPLDSDAFKAIGDQALIKATLDRLESAETSIEIERLSAAGISADRWTSPDLLAQLRAVSQSPAKFVIASALDLDPALPLQRRLATSHAMDIAAGAAALGTLSKADRVFLAVPEDMSPAGIAALRAAASTTDVRLYPLQMQYPLAHPSLLVRRITGRRVKPDQLPTQAGVLVLDAPAALSLGRWFVMDEPMRHVPVGIYDRKRSREHLLWVPVATPLANVLATVEINPENYELRVGQMLRDVSVVPDMLIGHGELTIFASDPHPAPQIEACLRCGWCVDACPVDIHPAGLLDAAQQHDSQLADRYGLPSCIQCGICSYVCPSRLPLLQSIRELRKGPKS